METSTGILQSVFGFDHFRGDQEAIICCLIGANDAFCMMPTGGRKKPVIKSPRWFDGVGVVITRLIALMQGKLDTLNQLGMHAAYLNFT